jgi:hypothetical protein
MRQIYTSPRLENIDRVVALLGEHGIQTRVLNRAVYKRRSYDRFRYTARNDRDNWPIVEIVHAEDLTPARNIMRDIGIEPPVRHSEILEAMRQRDAAASGGASRRDHAVRRARTIVLALLGVALVVMAIKAFQVF